MNSKEEKAINKIFKYIGYVLLLLLLGYVIINDRGLISYLENRGELNKLNEKISSAENKIEELKKEIELLKNDKIYIEKIAREKYGMMRENETGIEIEIKQ